MRGLYAITTEYFISTATIINDVQQALIGGATVIQYRDKKSSTDAREQIATFLRVLCHQYSAALIINDDVELAKKVDADGVHLGHEDMSLLQASEQLGQYKIIGISCYDDVEKARRVAAKGANYVAFGRFFPSTSKPEASSVSVHTLLNARQQLSLPIVAIGGITAQNGIPLIAAGADMLAVIDGVFGQNDISQAARDITSLFK